MPYTAVAQMVEQLHDRQQAHGSIPCSSTASHKGPRIPKHTDTWQRGNSMSASARLLWQATNHRPVIATRLYASSNGPG